MTTRLAALAPDDVGTKETSTVQDFEGLTVAAQLFVSAYDEASAPVSARSLIARAALPVFEIDTACLALVVPTISLLKDKLEGLTVTTGAVGVPPPVSDALPDPPPHPANRKTSRVVAIKPRTNQSLLENECKIAVAVTTYAYHIIGGKT